MSQRQNRVARFADGAAGRRAISRPALQPLLAEQRLLDLPGGRRARQRVEEDDRTGLLVAGEPAPHVLDDVRLAERHAIPSHHGRDRDLAPVRVGDAEHRRFGDPGMLEQAPLDLGGENVLAAALDHLLRAPGDVEEALVVERREVAGVEPAAAERVRGLLGHATVAEHVVLAPADDLAGLADADVAVVRSTRRTSTLSAGRPTDVDFRRTSRGRSAATGPASVWPYMMKRFGFRKRWMIVRTWPSLITDVPLPSARTDDRSVRSNSASARTAS